MELRITSDAATAIPGFYKQAGELALAMRQELAESVVILYEDVKEGTPVQSGLLKAGWRATKGTSVFHPRDLSAQEARDAKKGQSSARLEAISDSESRRAEETIYSAIAVPE